MAWIAAADALLHPSAIEAAPTVIREARALDVHVVACDVGDVAAWADDDPGIAVAEPNAAALAAAVERMI
jgi:glycosyltransferase involved in cell wall biosynthesis